VLVVVASRKELGEQRKTHGCLPTGRRRRTNSRAPWLGAWTGKALRLWHSTDGNEVDGGNTLRAAVTTGGPGVAALARLRECRRRRASRRMDDGRQHQHQLSRRDDGGG